MRILFLTDNYPPETNAPATRTFEHARRWVATGNQVTVVTCAPNFPTGRTFPGYRNVPLSVSWVDGIQVIRVWTYMAPNAGLLRRILDYVSFGVSAAIIAPLLRFDVVVATSPQFFTTVAGWFTAIIRRKPWVFELRDLWPESIKTVGAMSDGMAIRMLEKLEILLYRQSTKIIVVTHSFHRNLIARGIRAGKVRVVPNGANIELYQPQARDEQTLRRFGLQSQRRPIVGYLGTHGMAHALDFVVRCATERPEVDFVLIGDGAEKPRLHRMSADAPNVHLSDPVPKADVPKTLSIFDYALVNLRDTPTFRTVIPSKIFEDAAMEVPILLGVDGEVREIVERYGAGICYRPEDRRSFLEAIDLAVELLDTDKYRCMKDGCRQLANDYDRTRLADLMMNEIESIVR